MANYRLYHIDGAGKIETAEWLGATTDDEAIDQARAQEVHSSIEVWDRHRLVVRIGPDGEVSPDS